MCVRVGRDAEAEESDRNLLCRKVESQKMEVYHITEVFLAFISEIPATYW